MRWMGVLFSIFLIIAFGLVFNAVQANAIASAMNTAVDFERSYTGVAIVIISAFVIFRRVVSVRSLVLLKSSFQSWRWLTLLSHCSSCCEHRESAWSDRSYLQECIQSARSGCGWPRLHQSRWKAMINGIKRGLFSNEAGMGSAPNAAASATPYPPHPASQGYVQMLGVFMDTIVICSATVAIILMSGEYVPHGEVTGIELTQRCTNSTSGFMGWHASQR